MQYFIPKYRKFLTNLWKSFHILLRLNILKQNKAWDRVAESHMTVTNPHIPLIHRYLTWDPKFHSHNRYTFKYCSLAIVILLASLTCINSCMSYINWLDNFYNKCCIYLPLNKHCHWYCFFYSALIMLLKIQNKHSW